MCISTLVVQSIDPNGLLCAVLNFDSPVDGESLTVDAGTPGYDGAPKLMDEYLGRLEPLQVQYTEEAEKKQGPLAPRFFNSLRGAAYTAEEASEADVSKKEDVRWERCGTPSESQGRRELVRSLKSVLTVEHGD